MGLVVCAGLVDWQGNEGWRAREGIYKPLSLINKHIPGSKGLELILRVLYRAYKVDWLIVKVLLDVLKAGVRGVYPRGIGYNIFLISP